MIIAASTPIASSAVTQWEVVGCVPKITEWHVIPLIEAMLAQHPVPILGLHVDNGSEFINHRMRELLERLAVEFTKSRALRTTDNALIEGKNGAVVRKHMGYGHMASEHASRIQEFYVRHLNPYLNFHRPCGFATIRVDAKGKRRRKYPAGDYAAPYEKLKSLRGSGVILKSGLEWEALERTAKSASDTEFAERMRRAKTELLRACKMESPIPPRWEEDARPGPWHKTAIHVGQSNHWTPVRLPVPCRSDAHRLLCHSGNHNFIAIADVKIVSGRVGGVGDPHYRALGDRRRYRYSQD